MKKAKPKIKPNYITPFIYRLMSNDVLSFQDYASEAKRHWSIVDRVFTKARNNRQMTKTEWAFLIQAYLYLIPLVNGATKNSLEQTLREIRKGCE